MQKLVWGHFGACVILTHQNSALFEPLRMKIHQPVWSAACSKKTKNEKGYLAKMCYISHICGEHYSDPIGTQVGMLGRVPNVITRAKFHVDRSTGFRARTPPNLH